MGLGNSHLCRLTVLGLGNSHLYRLTVLGLGNSHLYRLTVLGLGLDTYCSCGFVESDIVVQGE